MVDVLFIRYTGTEDTREKKIIGSKRMLSEIRWPRAAGASVFI